MRMDNTYQKSVVFAIWQPVKYGWKHEETANRLKLLTAREYDFIYTIIIIAPCYQPIQIKFDIKANTISKCGNRKWSWSTTV